MSTELVKYKKHNFAKMNQIDHQIDTLLNQYLIKKKQSSCSMLQHVECVSPIVQKWDWTISHHCPEACSSRYFEQRDIQVSVNQRCP